MANIPGCVRSISFPSSEKGGIRRCRKARGSGRRLAGPLRQTAEVPVAGLAARVVLHQPEQRRSSQGLLRIVLCDPAVEFRGQGSVPAVGVTHSHLGKHLRAAGVVQSAKQVLGLCQELFFRPRGLPRAC